MKQSHGVTETTKDTEENWSTLQMTTKSNAGNSLFSSIKSILAGTSNPDGARLRDLGSTLPATTATQHVIGMATPTMQELCLLRNEVFDNVDRATVGNIESLLWVLARDQWAEVLHARSLYLNQNWEISTNTEDAKIWASLTFESGKLAAKFKSLMLATEQLPDANPVELPPEFKILGTITDPAIQGLTNWMGEIMTELEAKPNTEKQEYLQTVKEVLEWMTAIAIQESIPETQNVNFGFTERVVFELPVPKIEIHVLDISVLDGLLAGLMFEGLLRRR